MFSVSYKFDNPLDLGQVLNIFLSRPKSTDSLPYQGILQHPNHFQTQDQVLVLV